jgi:hypothetical protein
MPGSYLIAVWVISALAEIYVVVCSLYRRSFLQELPINSYMSAAVAVTTTSAICMHRFGFTSRAYSYFYYYTDSLMTILMFWVIIHFYQEVFKEMRVGQYVRSGAVLLLLATALFSFFSVRQHGDHLTGHVFLQTGQNLYFVGLVLTYLLWGAILKLRETRMRLVQLVLALGVYFSATAGVYAIGNLFPGLYNSFLRYLLPILATWLPVAWAYTLTRIPDEARLAAGSLLARAR